MLGLSQRCYGFSRLDDGCLAVPPGLYLGFLHRRAERVTEDGIDGIDAGSACVSVSPLTAHCE
jgi:hypothetical protein